MDWAQTAAPKKQETIKRVVRMEENRRGMPAPNVTAWLQATKEAPADVCIRAEIFRAGLDPD